jgi:Ca2+-binding EF-hand superfamily protein
MSKVKTKNATKTIQDPELIEMFNQLVGGGEPDPQIVIPKYEQLLSLSKDYINTLIKFVKSPIGSLPELAPQMGQIVEFIKRSQEQLIPLTLKEKEDKVLYGKNLDQINKNPELMEQIMRSIPEKYDLEELGEAYTALKDSPLVKEMLMTLKNIKRLLHDEKERTNTKTDNLENPSNLQHRFISRADGFDVTIFNFTNLNFKLFFTSYDTRENSKLIQYMLMFLRIMNLKCTEAYKIVTSPDIDVEKFSEMLINSIKDIRKHIPRCGKAFDKIEESVNLLNNNFDGYYKDFIQSQNPGIIIENFVLDVANDANADAQTTLQFREIIKFYKKNMKKENIKDPKVQKLFQMLGDNLDILEKKTDRKPKDDKSKDEKPKEEVEPMTAERQEEINKSFLPQTQTKKTKRKPKSQKK